jgi:hypothetical protein
MDSKLGIGCSYFSVIFFQLNKHLIIFGQNISKVNYPKVCYRLENKFET